MLLDFVEDKTIMAEYLNIPRCPFIVFDIDLNSGQNGTIPTHLEWDLGGAWVGLLAGTWVGLLTGAWVGLSHIALPLRWDS